MFQVEHDLQDVLDSTHSYPVQLVVWRTFRGPFHRLSCSMENNDWIKQFEEAR